VNPNPTVAIIPATIDTLCITSDPITLLGTPGGGSFSGTGVSGGVFFPSTAGIGSHVITYTYTDGNGCTGTTTVMAIVDQCSNSLNEVGLVGVSLFPNPNEGIFKISGLDIGTNYEIYDERGRLVSTGTTASEEQEVQLLDVQTGIYYLYATQNGKKGSLKFLITK
ncbi:MAG: T9SS type A sorting domain-containing protein, partial [Crocinitomicaceae bacterium]|nr:T9SS type A sorting domain-containing protein [Crocinitomicaceae bacterium]